MLSHLRGCFQGLYYWSQNEEKSICYARKYLFEQKFKKNVVKGKIMNSELKYSFAIFGKQEGGELINI